MLTTVFAIFGLSIGIINYEVDVYRFEVMSFFTENFHDDLTLKAMNSDRFLAWHTPVLRWVIFISTLMALACLIMRHYYKIQWLNQFFRTIQQVQTESKKQKERSGSSLFLFYNQAITGSGLNIQYREAAQKTKKLFNKSLLFEIILLGVIPLPFYERYVLITYNHR